MPNGRMPYTDSGFLEWSRRLAQKLVGAPSVYHVAPQRAAQFALLQQNFATAYFAALHFETRGLASVHRKNEARAEVEREARALARQIGGDFSVDAVAKVDAGLPLPKARVRIGVPDDAPVVSTELRPDDVIRVTLATSHVPGRPTLPRGVAGAVIYTHTGETYPVDDDAWATAASVSRTTFDLILPGPFSSGARMWIAARYFNPRQQRGPRSRPVFTYVIGRGVRAIATARAA